MATIRECVNGLRVPVRVCVRLYVCLCACVQVCVFAHSWSDSEGIQLPRRKRDCPHEFESGLCNISLPLVCAAPSSPRPWHATGRAWYVVMLCMYSLPTRKGIRRTDASQQCQFYTSSLLHYLQSCIIDRDGGAPQATYWTVTQWR